MRLKDKVCMITGGARGIGRATAERFLSEGAHVVIVDRDTVQGEQTARELATGERDCRFVAADVTQADTVEAAVRAIVDQLGRIDVLVNNAGVYPVQRWEDITVGDWERVIDVNLKSAFLCCKFVHPYMKRQGGGKIINLCSGVVFGPAPNFVHYTAAKAGVLGLTRALALELGDDHINVNAIAPGLVLTDTVAGDRPIEIVDQQASLRALKRREYPDDLVGTLTYLASSDSDFVTGQTIVIDGGRVLH